MLFYSSVILANTLQSFQIHRNTLKAYAEDRKERKNKFFFHFYLLL